MKLRSYMLAFIWSFFFSFGCVSASFALSLEEALSLSLDGSRELASSRQAWVSARENVYLSSGSGDFNLTFSGSGSVSRTIPMAMSTAPGRRCSRLLRILTVRRGGLL